MGRILLFAAAALLAATAAIHALGLPMVEEWTRDLGPERSAGLRLVWISDSVDWLVVALLWTLAAWKRERPWLAAAALAALIPAAVAAGLFLIDPSFFGGWMLAASVALAAGGLAMVRPDLAHGRVR